jgi:hypothetical protein
VSRTELTNAWLSGIKDVGSTCQPTILWEERIGEEDRMLWTILVVLLALWLLGLVTSYTLGGFVHILLVAAIIVVLVRFIQGRRGVI